MNRCVVPESLPLVPVPTGPCDEINEYPVTVGAVITVALDDALPPTKRNNLSPATHVGIVTADAVNTDGIVAALATKDTATCYAAIGVMAMLNEVRVNVLPDAHACDAVNAADALNVPADDAENSTM